jgi:hypothetical protein
MVWLYFCKYLFAFLLIFNDSVIIELLRLLQRQVIVQGMLAHFLYFFKLSSLHIFIVLNMTTAASYLQF